MHNRVQITWDTSSAYHSLTHAHVGQRDSSSVKCYRFEIAFILALFYWLKPFSFRPCVCVLVYVCGVYDHAYVYLFMYVYESAHKCTLAFVCESV